jgi:hypothetical protein
LRHELKYLIPNRERERLSKVISEYTVRDPHAGAGGVYTVRSIYLDTSRGAHYAAKMEGVRERMKVRIRGYNQTAADQRVSLELKRKSAATAWKRRAHLELHNIGPWLRGDIDIPEFDDPDAARTFKYFILRHHLKPAVLVVYEREAFESQHDPTLRITFDTALRGRLTAHIERLPAKAPVTVFDNHFILEVKFDYHFPSWMKPLLARLGAQRKALSKYTLTMDACACATHGRRASFAGGRVLRPGLMQTSV